MDYNLMAEKLIAVRKEIRKNVPMLNLIDHFNMVMDKQRERVFWYGSTFATDENRVNTRN